MIGMTKITLSLICILILSSCSTTSLNPSEWIDFSKPEPEVSSETEQPPTTSQRAFSFFIWVGVGMGLAGAIMWILALSGIVWIRGLGMNLFLGGIAVALTGYLIDKYALYVIVGSIGLVAGHLIPINYKKN